MNRKAEYQKQFLQITPPNFAKYLTQFDLETVNFQQFIPQEQGMEASAGAKKAAQMMLQKESPMEVALRVLQGKVQKVIVLNDEAHHCHHGDPEPKNAIKGKTPPKSEAPNPASYVWYTALNWLKENRLLHSNIYDFSATPFFLESAKAPLFPWIVSQYDLQEAEEAGIVKIMRLPDLTTTFQENSASLVRKITAEKLARNLYANSQESGKNITAEDDWQNNRDLKIALRYTYNDWNELRQEPFWQNHPTPPVLAIIVNTVNNAKKLHQYIAGYAEGEKGIPSRVGEELSNYTPNGEPHRYPRTLLVHSKMDELANLDYQIKNQAEVYRRLYSWYNVGKQSLLELSDRDVLRAVLNGIGQAGTPGEHIRCIISVAMLTEGWDARTVTHEIGFRKFGTQLLCEQAAGRALRRINYDLDPHTGHFPPEYAEIIGIDFNNLRRREEENSKPNDTPPQPSQRVEIKDPLCIPHIPWPDLEFYEAAYISGNPTLNPPPNWSAVEKFQIGEHSTDPTQLAPHISPGELNTMTVKPATAKEYHFLTASIAVQKITETQQRADIPSFHRANLFRQSLNLLKQAETQHALLPPINIENGYPNRYNRCPQECAAWLLKQCTLTPQPTAGQQTILPVKTKEEWKNSSELEGHETNPPTSL